MDNPFMAGAAPHPAWLAETCSNFDQNVDEQYRSLINSAALKWCRAQIEKWPGGSLNGLRARVLQFS